MRSTESKKLGRTLTQFTVQYPDQLPLEAWSSAFTALPQDVYSITEEHLSFAGALEEDPILLIAGFECADLSLLSPAGSRKGLQGSKSSTFYPLLSVLASLQRMRSSYAFPLAYLIENTATQYAYGSSRAMKDSFHELCAKIGSPVVLDAANVLPTLVSRVDSYAFRSRPDRERQGQVLNEEGNLVPLTLEERERILGYPTGSTDIPAISFNARHHILGSCFDAFAVSHLIACAFALRFSMVLPDDTYPSSHVSELGGDSLLLTCLTTYSLSFCQAMSSFLLQLSILLLSVRSPLLPLTLISGKLLYRIARYVESTGSTSEWDLFLPWIAYGYRVTPHESTKLSPYKMVYAVDPIMPSSAREHLTAPISYDDSEIAAKSVLDRSLLLAEHCATAGQNLLIITQHRDTLRYAKLRSGAYMPQLREFKHGQFAYIKDHDSMHDLAKSLILRVKEVRPSNQWCYDTYG
ncbi:hypothetical protein CEUSTIGMA_g13970.t1 [Chlamydomonas eustigma]|uniref:Uncharacterized protein n=1 Tax=Chlamydomonas eustigma TaxID=1157962 RepID=A0A250XU68_9CHLO|nr:hypothetical protein CEUSTIGMA_g13970.t1 [Chlamydomonas eustigma]|eukprot:GAX86563.1 hypothetical protein CEUSTIGMA_g13970.t1 [Chlamydomonas eustigma]